MTEQQDARIRELVPELVAAMARETDGEDLAALFPQIVIDREGGLRVTIHTPKPAVVIGPRGDRHHRLTTSLRRLTADPQLSVHVVQAGEAPDDDDPSLLRCSFCGKSQKAVSKLIAGPGVYICDECVALCDDIISEESDAVQVDKIELRPVANLSTAELLGELRRAAGVIQPVESHLNEVVSVLRQRGVSWAHIGEALGMSRQGAWSRFSGED